jgi:hypothetical protein
MPQLVEVRGLEELLTRMKRYPLEMHKALATTMSAALIAVWEAVPPYPPPPADSTYVRTGTLGKSLGSGLSGGSAGEPDIFTVRPVGSMDYEGKFGTRLEYAEFVIGENQAASNSHWWNIRTVAGRAAEKIGKLFNTLGEKLAAFLEGKG